MCKDRVLVMLFSGSSAFKLISFISGIYREQEQNRDIVTPF